MAFRANAARIYVTDAADAVTVFDTDETLFHGLNYVSGSVAFAAQTAETTRDAFAVVTYDDVNRDVDTVLASVDTNADHVVGAFSVETATPMGIANLGWFNAGGTYAHIMSPFTTYVAHAGYTFWCAAGTLYVNESMRLRAAPPAFSGVTTYTLLASTLHYRLFCGTFT